MKRVISCILFLLVICNFIQASYKFDVLSVEGYAKGYAITADKCGLESVLKNPAGVSLLESVTFLTSYSSFFDDFYQGVHLAAGLPINDTMSLAITIPARVVSGIPETIDNGGRAEQVGSFQDLDAALMFTTGLKILPDLYCGLNTNYYYHKLYTQKGTGWGFDFGFLYDINYDVTLGASIQNMGNTKIKWSTGHQDTFSQIVNVGLKYKWGQYLQFLADTSISQGKTELNLGAEKTLEEILSIYFGVQNIGKEARIGAGASLLLENLDINYAYSQHMYLGSVHKLSLGMRI